MARGLCRFCLPRCVARFHTMKPHRSVLRLAPLALALIVALTSLTMAVARGQGRPVGQTVLCLAIGTVSVAVDAQGRPTGPVHLCPDAAPALFVADGIAPPLLPRPVRRVTAISRPAPAPVVVRPGLPPMARGPPVWL